MPKVPCASWQNLSFPVHLNNTKSSLYIMMSLKVPCASWIHWYFLLDLDNTEQNKVNNNMTYIRYQMVITEFCQISTEIKICLSANSLKALNFIYQSVSIKVHPIALIGISYKNTHLYVHDNFTETNQVCTICGFYCLQDNQLCHKLSMFDCRGH